MAVSPHVLPPASLRRGALLIQPCPGRRRPFRGDVASLKLLQVTCLLGLVEPHELPDADDLGDELAAAGIEWLHMPVPDFGIPPSAALWREIAGRIHPRLDRGETVAIHCWGGLGRSGMIAARLLAERGRSPEGAVAKIRQVRPGAIETDAQEAWIATAGTAA